MNEVIITNNPLVEKEYKRGFSVELKDTDLLGVLLHVRDLIHKGYELLTHPLSGSIKPNETLYKTVLLRKNNKTDFQSVEIIEKCIETVKKFPPKQIGQNHLHDMQTVDLEHIKTAM
ncbi:MAG: GrdX family protein [Oscillospiraceae bacterium]|nr:GrdX family protein [Oscillospiraceae bacterium]